MLLLRCAATVLALSLAPLEGDPVAGPPPARAWPVADHRVVSAFRPPNEDWGAGHRGVDLPATTGEPVRAVTAGVVGFVGAVGGKGVVTVLLGDGRRLTYEPVVAAVHAGDPVAPGDALGTVASAGGHCGGRAGCLHLGLRDGTAYLDPSLLLPGRAAVLKPWRSRDRRSPADGPR